MGADWGIVGVCSAQRELETRRGGGSSPFPALSQSLSLGESLVIPSAELLEHC